MKTISIIPARGGSKGIPRKNIKKLGGIPLIAHTIQHSISSKMIDETIVSTEDEEIKQISLEYGATVIDRPKHLAGDTVSTEAVLKHVLDKINYKVAVLLQCTSPIRKIDDIDKAVLKLSKNGYDSVLSACRNHNFLWDNLNGSAKSLNYDYDARPRRQDMNQYRENGSIYVFTKKCFDEYYNRLGGKIGIYEMDERHSIEIDTLFDFWLVEQILGRGLI